MKKFLVPIFIVVAVGGGTWLSFIFITGLLGADESVQAGLIGLLGVLIAAIFTQFQTRKREIASRHFSAKSDGYKVFFDLLFDLMKAAKSGKQLSDQKLIKGIMEVKKSLMIWGNAEVIAAWNEYERKSANSESGVDFLEPVETLLRAIRKDLGHNDLLMEPYQLTQMFLDEESKKELIGGN